MSEELSFDVHGPVASITLRRAAKLNALTPAMLDGLTRACNAIEADPAIRCAVLLAEGKAFCAGADINAWSGLTPIEMWQRWIVPGHSAFGRLAALRVPTLAVVEGACFWWRPRTRALLRYQDCVASGDVCDAEVSIGTLPGWGGTGACRARWGCLAPSR